MGDVASTVRSNTGVISVACGFLSYTITQDCLDFFSFSLWSLSSTSSSALRFFCCSCSSTSALCSVCSRSSECTSLKFPNTIIIHANTMCNIHCIICTQLKSILPNVLQIFDTKSNCKMLASYDLQPHLTFFF